MIQSRLTSRMLAPIWLMRMSASIAAVLGKARLPARMKSGMASTGQDTPTMKKSGRLTATSSSTAVSRRLNHAPTNCARKLTDRTNGTASRTRSSSRPSVEKPYTRGSTIR